MLLAGEQLAVAPVDALEQRGDVSVEAPEVAVSGQGGDTSPFGVVLGKAMGLLVGDHLRPVLQPAQAGVGARHLRGRVGRHVPVGRQGGEGVQGARRAQVAVASAQDQLLGLDIELDLADAAAPQLQVGAARGHRFAGLVGMDLALDRMDVGDGSEVEVAPPDEGFELIQERLPAWDVAGRGPGLDERRPLPVLADALVVFEGRVHRHRRPGRGRIRPQAQVDPEHIALDGPRLQNLRHRLGEANREGLALDPVGKRHGRGLVEHRHVDVAGVVQLERAVLAHGDGEKAGDRSLVAFSQPGDPPGLQHLPRGEPERAAHRFVGEPGQGAGDLVQVPDRAQVGERGQQVQPRLGHAQRRLAGGPVGRVAGSAGGLEDVGQAGLRVVLEDVVQLLRSPARQAQQVRRGGEHRLQLFPP